MAENNDTLTFHSTNAAPDPRIIPARLAFAADLVEKGTAIIIRNYLLDGKLIQVCLYQDGRIEQRDTASHVTKISSLTIKITVNGMTFEIDQHAILSTPNDLIHAVKAGADEVHISQILSMKLRGIDTIAMVLFKYFLTAGIVDTSKAQSVTHIGPSSGGYKLSVQLACLKLAVTLKAPRFLTHVIKEIEYVWLPHDLSLPQLIAMVQVTPYLDRFLVLWTFVLPGCNLVEKDSFIGYALENLPRYRNLIRQHAIGYTGKPMMPSVHSFLAGIAQDSIGNGLAQQPSDDDLHSPDLAVGPAALPINDGNLEEDNNDDDTAAVMATQLAA